MRKILFFILRWTMLPGLCRWFLQRGRITLLLYHNIRPASFAKHIAYIEKHYRIISLKTAVDLLSQGRPLDRVNYLVVTFDDGLQDNLALLDIFARHPGMITLFVCSAIVGTQRGFWFQSGYPDIEGLKRLPNQQRLDTLQSHGFNQEKEYPEKSALTELELAALRHFVDLQSHTRFHPCLPFCSNEEAFDEIVGSKKELESRFGFQVDSISYPNGDYCDRDLALARQCGYRAGVTVDHGFNEPGADLFRLKRLSVNDTDDMNEFIVKATGLWGVLIKRILKPRHGDLTLVVGQDAQ